MKKSVISFIIITILLSFYSCTPYEDYYDDFEYTTAYFAYPEIDRSVIIDEYDFIQVGAVLGGKLENDTEEWVQYEMVDTLVTNEGYQVLPEALYETSNDELGGMTNVITIPEGEFLGMMKITLKPEFFADSNALSPTYALAFRITDASTDSIGNDVTIVTFKYVSNAVGFYEHRGVAISSADTLEYQTAGIELVTNAPEGTNSVRSDMVQLGPLDLEFDMTMDDDYNITLTSGPDSDAVVTETSPGFFDEENDHNIYLNYSFDYDGNSYTATDTLEFVRRVIDGIEQWDTSFF
ncbi:MAG TPA: DUF1735 domain-containing protein [Bacteroidales bacterium]|nr:DUF1735 domain-containing protein [Bacteroidales bacterium]